MKRSLFAVLTIAIIVGILAGLRQATTAPEPTAAQAQPATAAPAAGAPVAINFWHAMSGHNGEVIEELTKRFNESQSEVVVTATFQGSYDDEINKLKAGLQSKDVPAVVQVYDLGTRLLVDLKVITPMQDFIDREGFDVSEIEPNVANYYSIDGRLQSMPFNTSNPSSTTTRTCSKRPASTPKRPRTWDEVAEYARKLTIKDASGTVTQWGCTFALYGWFVEQFIAVQGGYYVNNENATARPRHRSRFQRLRCRPSHLVEEHDRRRHLRQPRPLHHRHQESL